MGIKKAQKLILKNKFKEAEELLENISEKNPEILYLIAYSLFNQEKYIEALEKLKVTLEIKEDYSSAYHLEGYCHLMLSRYDMAEESLLRSLKFNESPHVNYLLGKVYYGKKEKQKSIENFYFALNNGIIYNDIYKDLSELHFEEGEFSDALRNLEFLFELTPEDPYINYMIGRCLFNLSRYKEAIKQMKKNLLYDLEDIWRIKTIYLLALSYCGIKRFNSAEKTIRKSLNKYPDCYEYYELLGRILISRMDYRRGREVFKKTLKLNLTLKNEPLFYIAFTYIIENKFKKAIEKFKEIISLWPDDIKSHYSLAIIYYNTGKIQEALEHWYKCIEISQDEKLSIKAGEYIKSITQI